MYRVFIKDALAPLVLRLALAAVFLFHGYLLVFSEGNDWGTNWMKAQPNQEPPPPAVQAAVAWGQFVGGIALAVGFLTRLAALGLAVIMAGAIYLVHLPKGFNILEGGYEYNVVLIAVCLALICWGGGGLSLDRWLFGRRWDIVPAGR